MTTSHPFSSPPSRPDADAISRLFTPRSVAVIGASADPAKTAGRPVSYLMRHGYAGAIYPVNPRVEAIAGIRCYPDIGSLPEVPDVASSCSARACASRCTRTGGPGHRGGDRAGKRLYGDWRGRRAPTGRTGRGRRQHALARANTIGLVNVTDSIPLSASGALEMEQFPASFRHLLGSFLPAIMAGSGPSSSTYPPVRIPGTTSKTCNQ
ncbi:hypothetical protein AWV80_12715 [Cupriavidus sp. UYMU48A]|nr:hypothetical protein AWV80_12715 [Cupriavidus sp. UYMU48A]